MHHAAAKNLHPVGAVADTQAPAFPRAADVHLGGWFGEGEVARAEAHRQVFDLEERPRQIDQTTLEMAMWELSSITSPSI